MIIHFYLIVFKINLKLNSSSINLRIIPRAECHMKKFRNVELGAVLKILSTVVC